MSALSEAVPLPPGAPFHPPAILVLILLLASEHPRRLVFAYLAGAALIVFGVGVVFLGVLAGTGATEQDSSSASAGVQIALGLLLLALSAWAWARRDRPPAEPDEDAGASRLSQWSARATTSARWAFVLGIAMYLPSPMYLAAIKAIADSGDPTASKLTAVLICGACVLLFVEIPAIALLLRPDGLQRRLEQMRDWLAHNGWRLLAVLAALAGVYALVKGLAAL
ncbi:MAG TPA: GAP family protein [Solirubrobacteraceae bacterium]|nr:GAP family protein [Solirubrobacteraceae bacterium]